MKTPAPEGLSDLVRASPTVLYRREPHAPFAFTFVSENAATVMGSTPGAFTRASAHWADYLHPDDRSRVELELASIADAAVHQLDYRWRHRPEEYRWIRDQVRRAGSQLLGAWTDITSWKRSEAALDSSRRRLQALFNYSLDAILLANDDAKCIDANPAACELTGYSRQALLTRTLWDLVPAERMSDARGRWETVLTTGEVSGQSVILKGDGTIADVEFRAVAHVMPGAHLIVVRDASDRASAERAREQHVSRLEVLSEIDRAILEADSPAAVADAALRRISRLLPCARASVWLLDAAHTDATVVAVWSVGSTALGPGTRLPLAHATFLAPLLQGQAVLVQTIKGSLGDAVWERTLLAEGLQGFRAEPIRAGGRTIGALNIWSSGPAPLSPIQAEMSKELADRLSVAISNARLLEESRASAARLSAISRRLLEVQETDRRDIARELHDEFGQILTGLKLGLGAALAASDGAVADNLRQAQRLVDDLVAQVRRLSLNLRPPALDGMGLLDALAWHFERYTAQTGIRVQFEHAGIAGRFSIEIETAAYRVVQESLTNVARHAGVDSVHVAARAEAGWLRVMIEDAGRGFDASAPSVSTAGLTGMAERISLIGGRFHIESAPGRTAVIADIPIDGEGP